MMRNENLSDDTLNAHVEIDYDGIYSRESTELECCNTNGSNS